MNATRALQAIVAIHAFLAGICAAAQPTIIYVDAAAIGKNNGSSWVNAYRYLQDALTKAWGLKGPVEIDVAQGIYTPDRSSVHPKGTRDRSASFALVNATVVKGGFAGAAIHNPGARDTVLYETILSGDLAGDDIAVLDPCDLLSEPTRSENSFSVVTAANCSRATVLDGCTITGGHTMRSDDRRFGGGGLYLSASQPSCCPTIKNCLFVGNFGSRGGAAFAFEADSEFVNCLFTQNATTTVGGALALFACSAGYQACPFTVKGCIFAGNYAAIGGGAIKVYSAVDLFIEDCTFTKNFAPRGGAIEAAGDGPIIPNVANCLFVHNDANTIGGAICFGPGELSMASCSFFGNTSPQGTALACPFWLSTPATIARITNVIFRDGGDEIHLSQGNNAEVTYSDIQGGWPGEGNIDADPLFADPVNWDPNTPHDPNDPWIAGDYHLKSQAGRWDPNSQSWVKDSVTSPCIDAGDPNSPVGDEPEPNGGRINMGAYGGTAEASKSDAAKL